MDDRFSEFRLFYEMNKDKFPEDFRGTVEEFAEMATFYYEVYEPCAERMVAQLRRLLFEQYPVLRFAKHPAQLKYIGEIVDTTPFSLVYGMKRLLKEQRESRASGTSGTLAPATHPSLPSKEGNATRKAGGTPQLPSGAPATHPSLPSKEGNTTREAGGTPQLHSGAPATHPSLPSEEGNTTRRAGADEYVRAKYPKIDEWREFYGKPEEPTTMSDESRNIYLWPKDEDWEKYKAEQNEEMRIFHEWQQRRLREYYDIVQPLLFEYLPELENFEGDFWVLYAVTLRDEYESWKDNCEHLENSIEYHLPPESVDWEWEVYKNALREARPKYQEEVLRKRDERIRAGDK